MTIAPNYTLQPYSQNSFAYIQQNAALINQLAAQLGIPAASIAAPIERELAASAYATEIQIAQHEFAVDVANSFDNSKNLYDI